MRTVPALSGSRRRPIGATVTATHDGLDLASISDRTGDLGLTGDTASASASPHDPASGPGSPSAAGSSGLVAALVLGLFAAEASASVNAPSQPPGPARDRARPGLTPQAGVSGGWIKGTRR
jgi:hypothetical protein